MIMYVTGPPFLPASNVPQTARITDIESGTVKVELRGHENRVECAVFVSTVSTPAVRELVALVCLIEYRTSYLPFLICIIYI